MAEWLVRQRGSEPIGPLSTELVLKGIEAGRVTVDAEVCLFGTNVWRPLEAVPEFASFALDEDIATRVTDSPWFMNEPPSSAPARKPPRPPPPRPAPGGKRPIPSHRAFDDGSDEEPTDVASPSELKPRGRPADFPIDDQTMTRVRADPKAAPPSVRQGGVLPTLPMHVLQEMQADLAARGAPRPAAGEPAPPTQQQEAEPMPPTRPFVEGGIPPTVGNFSAPPAYPPAAQTPPPPGYYTGPGVGPEPYDPYAQPPYPPQEPKYPPRYQEYPAQQGGDQSLKLLIFLIVFLFVALAVVLLLLAFRR